MLEKVRSPFSDDVTRALGANPYEPNTGYSSANPLGELAVTKAILLGAILNNDSGAYRWEYNGENGPRRDSRERAAACFLLYHGLTIEP